MPSNRLVTSVSESRKTTLSNWTSSKRRSFVNTSCHAFRVGAHSKDIFSTGITVAQSLAKRSRLLWTVQTSAVIEYRPLPNANFKLTHIFGDKDDDRIRIVGAGRRVVKELVNNHASSNEVMIVIVVLQLLNRTSEKEGEGIIVRWLCLPCRG